MRRMIGLCIGILGVSVLGCNLTGIKDLDVRCAKVVGIKLASGMCGVKRDENGEILQYVCDGCSDADQIKCDKYISDDVFKYNRCPLEYVCSTIENGEELNTNFCILRRDEDKQECAEDQIFLCGKGTAFACESSCEYCDQERYDCYRVVGTEDGDGKCENGSRECRDDKSYLCVNGEWLVNAECVNGCNTKKGGCKTCLDDTNICKAEEKCTEGGKCVAKTCLDDASICKADQKCTEGGECVAKNCKDDAAVCLPSQKCNEGGECVPKTCEDEPSICSASEVCKSGVCLRKSCTENEALCGEDNICLNGVCVSDDEEKTPIICDDAGVNYFWGDHFDLIDRILKSEASGFCDIYNDMQSVLATSGTVLCNRIELCNNPEVVMSCMGEYVYKLIRGEYAKPSGYESISLNTGHVVKIYSYLKDISECESVATNCTENPSVCSEYQQCNVDGKCVPLPCRLKPEICGEHYQCIDDVCVRNTCDIDAEMCGNAYCHAKSKECYQKSCEDEADEDTCSSHIAYCGNKLVTELFYSHYRYIADIASGDKAKQCKAFSELEKLFANEGRAICHKIDYCSSGSSTSYFRCLADYVVDIYLGKVTPPEAYKDVSITMSVGNTIVNYYLNPESICGGN